MSIKKWETLKSEVVFHDRIKLRKDVPLLPNGKKGDYVYIDCGKGSAVAVVVMNDKKQILLKREYRYPVSKIIYDIPGGGRKRVRI